MTSPRIRMTCLALLGLFALPGAALAADDSPTVEVPKIFSYQAPVGWTVQTLPSAAYPAATQTQDGALQGMITVEIDHAPGPLLAWCDASMKKNAAQFAQYNIHPGEMTPFATTAGQSGFRITISLATNGKDLSSTDYFFAGSADAKLVVTCTCAQSDAFHYAPIFDAAMKTFVAH